MAIEIGGVSSHASAFWATFVPEHWERKPACIPIAAVGCPYRSEDVYRVGVALREGYDALREVRKNLFIDCRLVMGDIRGQLPSREDGDLAGYARRMRATLGPGVDWLLIICHTQLIEAGLYDRAREFMAPIHAAAGGLPTSFCDIDFFVGDYRHTPFGVHTDTASNVMFTLEGEKVMRQWPPSYDRHPLYQNVLPYDHLRDDGVPYTGDPETVVYWPSSYWHVGEQPRGFTVTANLVSYYEDGPVLQAAEGMLEAALEDLPEATCVTAPTSSDVTLPVAYTQALSAFAHRLADGSATDAVLRQHMVRLSTGGFWAYFPPLGEAPALRPGDLVHSRAAMPVLRCRLSTGATLLAANGHLRETSDLGLRLVDALDRTPCTIEEVLGRARVGAAERNDALDLLRWCAAARGIGRVSTNV